MMQDVRPTHLLHLAWYTNHGEYWTSPENLSWVASSLELLRQFADNGGKRVVMAGTCAEYDWTHGVCTESGTPLANQSLYAACKNALHAMVEAFAKQVRLSYAWGRLFFLYGPHEPPSRLVPSVIASLLRGERATCRHGHLRRDFLYVTDAAQAFATLVQSEAQGAFNIASGTPVPLGELVRTLAERLERPELLDIKFHVSTTEPELVVADVSRLRRECHWQPAESLESGLAKTIAWWKSHIALERT